MKLTGAVTERLQYLLREIPSLAKFGLAFGWSALTHLGEVSDKQFYQLLSSSLLSTPLQDSDIAYFESVCKRRGLSRWAVWISFFRLSDATERRWLKGRAFEAHHAARQSLVETHLPAGETILDIGGASDTAEEGALLAMGYPFIPKQIWIVDLPIDKRVGTSPEVNPVAHKTKGGTSVQYVYSSMADLSAFRDGQFDLVWSGQSIEHITQEEATSLAKQVRRVLKPGGYFCLDTPNRKLSRLLSHKTFAHPDHKKEYESEELIALLRGAGFQNLQSKGVTPLPISSRLGRISKLEILENTTVTDDSAVGFSFYLSAQKPYATH